MNEIFKNFGKVLLLVLCVCIMVAMEIGVTELIFKLFGYSFIAFMHSGYVFSDILIVIYIISAIFAFFVLYGYYGSWRK